ncbi:unnamed protein product [Lymnaea stagnalis]|uniref:Kazal-like domain-containing protein n=1 Tax=Lymnaea stagnalis TaxID=6523 RepID=A0AAV2HS41_LYMST
MSKYDQRWVGAWWLGFLIVGVASVAFSLPIMFFPRRIRYDQDTSHRKTQNSSNADSKKAAVKKVILDMPKSLSRIFRRPVYVLALVGGCIDGFGFSGWFAFSQKYIETQFNKTPQQVSLTTGIIVIFSLALGTFSGGFLTSRFKLGLRGCVMMALAISAGTLALDVMYMVFGCENSQVMGLGDTRTQSSQQCACNSDIFLVCGDNNVDYRSPCWAGCTNSTNMIFSNCSEINGGQAKPGLCSLDCPFFIPFLVIYCLGMLIGCSSIVPGFMIIVRSIEQRDQSLATGASAFCQTLIGFLPAPLVFGKLIDSTCRLWSPTGDYCMLYDRERFRFIFNGLYIGLRAGHLVILTLVLLLVRRLHGRRDKDGIHGRESKTISPTT